MPVPYENKKMLHFYRLLSFAVACYGEWTL